MKTFTVLFLFSLLFALATSSLLKQTPAACVIACQQNFNTCFMKINNASANPELVKHCAPLRTACCAKSPCKKKC